MSTINSTYSSSSSENFSNISKNADPGLAVLQIYYSPLYRGVMVVSASIILILGLLGNFAVAMVISRSRQMRSSTNVYLVSVALADVVVLLSSIVPVLAHAHRVIELWALPRFACPLVIYAQFLGVNASALTIASFSYERWVAVCRPLRAHSLCTVPRALRITAAVWLFNVIYNSPWLMLVGVSQHRAGKPICTYQYNRRFYRVVYMVDFLLFYCLPLLVTVGVYADIIRIIVRRPQLQAAYTASAPSTNASAHSKASHQAKVQMIKMLMTVVALFAVLWLPYRAWMVYNSFIAQPWIELWYSQFAKTMVYINSAVNPILYNAMSAKFRKAFKEYFFCSPRRVRRPSTMVQY